MNDRSGTTDVTEGDQVASQSINSGPEQLHLARALSEFMNAKGFVDFHIHADRVSTGKDEYFRHEGGYGDSPNATLVQKQDTVGILHRGPAFEEAELLRRMDLVVRLKIAAGESAANFIVDCSPDVDGRAFRAALELRTKYADKIDIRAGAYPIFGLKEWGSDRELHLRGLAPEAQFIVALPERDARGDHPIGFEGHLGVLYELAQKHRLPLHVHVDQTNTPGEDGTWRLINCVRSLSARFRPEDRPQVWAVHLLIDGKEDPERLEIICDLKDLNIGVVCCPYAAGSMRQLRNFSAPLHSSLAPIRECIVAGIPVYFGTDNTDDHLMPLPKLPLVLREMDMAASLARFYSEGVLWKIARGQLLNSTDIASVARNLDADYQAFGMKNPWARFTS